MSAVEETSNVFTPLNRFPTVLSLPHFVTLCFFPFSLSFSLSGGSGEGLSEGERTGRVGVAESDIIGDVAIGPALTHIVRGRVQRGGLRQEVSPSSYIIRALQTNSGNKNIIIVLLPLFFSFLLSDLKLQPHTLARTCKIPVVLSTLCVCVCMSKIMYALASGTEREEENGCFVFS